MGQKVSRVYGSLVKRPLQRYNVEHRAEKVLTRIEDPTASPIRSPMFETDRQLLDELRKTNPELLKSTVSKDEGLTSRLRDVYVTSEDPTVRPPSDNPPPRGQDPNRPLPLDRTRYPEKLDTETILVTKPNAVPRGKVTLEDAVSFISEHAMKPETVTASTISDKYRLNPDATAQALKYFGLFKSYVPPEKEYKKPYDALEAGKDWVDLQKEKMTSTLEVKETEMKRKQLLKERDEKRRKQKLLEEGQDKGP